SDNHEVTGTIIEAFQQYFNESWRNCPKVNSAKKDQWFNMWKGIEIDPNVVYLEVVGERKRGLIPGLWTVGDLVLDMETQCLQREQEQLKVQKEKLVETRKMNEYLDEMKRTMQDYRDAS
ncbi:tRNA pseudouridine synthase B, partial [Bienertia sinuspersici]